MVFHLGDSPRSLHIIAQPILQIYNAKIQLKGSIFCNSCSKLFGFLFLASVNLIAIVNSIAIIISIAIINSIAIVNPIALVVNSIAIVNLIALVINSIDSHQETTAGSLRAHQFDLMELM